MDRIQLFKGLEDSKKNCPYILTKEQILSLDNLGYCVVNEFLTKELIVTLINDIYTEFKSQISEWSIPPSSPEYGQVRSPFLSSDSILDLIVNSKLTALFRYLLIGSPIYHLVNGQVTQPNSSHNQTCWHRDLNKAHISKPPLAFNALTFLGELSNPINLSLNNLIPQSFDIVPKSHKIYGLPDFSSSSSIVLIPGSVLIFNSLLWHRVTNSSNPQFFLNIMATEPFIKQQIDKLGASNEWLDAHGGLESTLAQFLGFWSKPPSSIEEFRNPIDGIRSYRSGQG